MFEFQPYPTTDYGVIRHLAFKIAMSSHFVSWYLSTPLLAGNKALNNICSNYGQTRPLTAELDSLALLINPFGEDGVSTSSRLFLSEPFNSCRL